MTDLLKYLVKRAKTINPKIHASAIGCVSYLRAYEEAFQEWPLWVNTDIVEFVTMMNYPEDNTIYSKNITALKQHVIDFRKVNLTVGAYKFVHNPEPFKKQYDLCKQADARSCVIFHYNSLLENTQMADYLVN